VFSLRISSLAAKFVRERAPFFLETVKHDFLKFYAE
jgi:hypothetical protein